MMIMIIIIGLYIFNTVSEKEQEKESLFIG